MTDFVELNGLRIFYDVAGGGPPCLLIMGLATPHVGWDYQLAAFRARHRTAVYDNRGCGRSPCPRGGFSIRDMAEDAAALMTALGLRRAHVVGVSMGGMIAQELALGWPGKVGALVLASTYAAPPESVRRLSEPAEDARRDPMASVRRLVELTFTPEFVAREAAALAGLFARGSPEGFDLAGLRAQAAATLEFDARARLPSLRAPTLVLTGDRDAFIPASASDELAALIPGARLARIAGGSHGANFERAADWNELVLSFLGEHDALIGKSKSQ